MCVLTVQRKGGCLQSFNLANKQTCETHFTFEENLVLHPQKENCRT